MIDNHIRAWSKCLEILKDNMSIASFKTWFKPIIPLKLDEKTLTIQVPTYFFYEYLEEHYVGILKKVLKKVLGEGAKLEYNIVIENQNSLQEKNSSTTANISSKKVLVSDGKSVSIPSSNNAFAGNTSGTLDEKEQIDSQLNSGYTFDNFVEGECNRLARSAGLAVAKDIGRTAFNPLFVYGDSGLGKTHLVQAIGINIKNSNPDKVVLYTNANIFQTQFTESIRKNTRNDFINFYQKVDTLIIDDIHEFAGKEKTQNTFFHIFNQLHQLGKQLILTSDRAPVHLEGLEARLLSRFKWGLSVDLQMPDKETRVKILHHRAYKDGVRVPEEVVDYVAENVKENVRVLEGVFIALLAHSTLMKEEVTVELAEKIIKKLVTHKEREITIDHIQNVVCSYFDVDKDALQSRSRKREIAQSRQISMYFSKKYTGSSLAAIGAKIGRRDHATVLHAYKTVSNLLETDKKYRYCIEEIDKMLQS